jgi:uncharacterized membrane protein
MSTPRSIKPLVIALVISVCLNMFGAGLLAATRYAHRGERPRPGFALGPRGFLSRAGLDDDPAQRKILEGRRHKLHAEREALLQAREDVRSSLATEPFDRPRLEGSLSALRNHAVNMQTEMHSALIDLAQTLPAPERERLAQAPWLMDAEGMHGRKMRRGHGDARGDDAKGRP